MSAINALAGSGSTAASGSRFNELSSEEFIRIIFTELQNQDPFKPNDSGALLEQLNSIRSIESDIQMQNRLESIVFQNQLSSAGALIGKRVAGLTSTADRVGGTVQSVARSGDEIALVLDNGWIIPMENIEYIDAQPTDPQGNGAGNAGGSASGGGNAADGAGGSGGAGGGTDGGSDGGTDGSGDGSGGNP
ncbi:MAG: hypothetical protein RLZZ238_1337 [Planctomycetota bacterium]